MKSKIQLRILLPIISVFLFILIVAIIIMSGVKKDKKLRVGFVMTGTITEQGWNKLHYDGIKNACEELDATLIVKENIKENEGQCEQAIHELLWLKMQSNRLSMVMTCFPE